VTDRKQVKINKLVVKYLHGYLFSLEQTNYQFFFTNKKLVFHFYYINVNYDMIELICYFLSIKI